MSNITNQNAQQMATSTVSSMVATPTQPNISSCQPVNQSIDLNHHTFQAWIDLLVDPSSTEDLKLKTVQDLSLSLDAMQTLPSYSQLIDYAMERFVKVLTETEPHFISESSIQQLRKKLLEIIQRTTSILNNNYLNSDQRTEFVKKILMIIYGLIEKENEENVIICLKIITDYHRLLKSLITNEVQQFFNFVKNIYRQLPNNMSIVFNHKSQIKLNELNESTLERLLSETYSTIQIHTEKLQNSQTYTMIPRGTMSLKVLAECPLTTVMIYNYNKNQINQEISEIIPLIANVVALQPTDEQRLNPDNEEIYADFVTAQVKALSFLAFFKSHKDYLINNSDLVVSGIMQLLKNCPPEVVSVRKDLLAISRHIISDLRTKFLPYINQFFDETTFCSTGYTASESLRTSACSIVADYIHNVRKQLTYQDLCKAITYFSKSLHDPLLNISLQHMCCRVLLSLIECIKAKDPENIYSRDLILKLFEVIVLKFKSIANYQVTYLLESNTTTNTSSVTSSSSIVSNLASRPVKVESNASQSATADKSESDITGPIQPDKKAYIEKLDLFINAFEDKDRVKLKYGPSSVIILNETDCRYAIKSLILASRNITAFLIETKPSEISVAMQPKQLTPRETFMYVKFLKNALLSMDVYMIGRGANSGKNSTNPANLATQKEEKEVIENLGVIFSYLHQLSLSEIFTQTIDFIIERTFKNSNIYILSSYFLATPATSCTFATILIEYLLKKMEIMGDSSIERSNLYLKLFKLVFGSVSVLAAENEKMLKPHLHSLVTKSLELALKAKEPYNYFLLLRALFRSIGGGNHDLLYQEFLPLLPVLLQSLNELQTGLHKQYLKDLFVELCLTVPVRLSSLLPYLPMLMDPLVSALNGSPTLISQGLRTLELCVDNLQADFLYDHIQPVQTDLIQGLWRNIRSPSDSIAHVAYRVLGKLGGTNRIMITEPQKLKFNTNSNDCKEFNGPTIKVSFPNYTANIEVSLEKVFESCQNILKCSTSELFYKKHAFKIVSSFLAVLLPKENDKEAVNEFFKNFNPINSTAFTQYLIRSLKFDDEFLRQTVELSLACVYYASNTKEIKNQVLCFLDSLVVYFTLLSLSHYNNQEEAKVTNLIQSNVFTQSAVSNPTSLAAPSNINSSSANLSRMTSMSNLNINAINQHQLAQNNQLDFMILIDAIFKVLSNDDMDYWPVAQRSVLIIIETSEIISGGIHLSENKQSDSYLLRGNLANSALFDYLAEKVSSLCYERSWYAKKAGCLIIKLLCKKLPLTWSINNCLLFIRSIVYILISVMGEISSGAINIAQESLELLINICLTKLSDPSALSQEDQINYQKLIELQKNTLNDILKEFIRQMTSSNVYVRKESMKLIKQIAENQKQSVYNLIHPFQEILFETVAPRKHCKLRHYTTHSQIGILEGIEFCSSTQPQLFTLNMSNQDHSNLFQEIIPICEGDEVQLAKNICYKNLSDLTPLRKAALNTLASFYQLLEQREIILSTLHRALASPILEIQQTSFACLKKFSTNTEMYSSSLRAAAAANAAAASANGTTVPPNPVLENLRQTMQIAADYLKDYLNPLTDYSSLNLNVMQHLSYITQLYPTILNEKFSEYLLSHLRSWLESVHKIMSENSENSQLSTTTGATSSSTLQSKSVSAELKVCASIISLLAELQSAPSKLVDSAILLVLKYERIFMLEVNNQFRAPLSNLLKRYPVETLKYLLNLERIKDPYSYRFVIYLIKTQPSFSMMFKRDTSRLSQMVHESQAMMQRAINSKNSNDLNPNDLMATSNQIQFLAILIFYRLTKLDTESQWIVNQGNLIDCFLEIWCDDRFHEKHKSIDQLDYIYWKEPIYLVKIFLKFHKAQLNLSSRQPSESTNFKLYPSELNIELLFKLLIAFQNKLLVQYEFLRIYFKDVVAKTYSCEWKRAAFFKFVQIFNSSKPHTANKNEALSNEPSISMDTSAPLSSTDIKSAEKQYNYSQKLKANILQYILIPCFQNCFENNQHIQLIGSVAQPEIDSDDNIISVFINKVVEPDTNLSSISDATRIFLLQLSSLFVQYAHDHIHDVNNKKQGTKLRRLMTFAWPCVLTKTCVDPFNKYHGHLLLSYIISKFAIHKRIVQQVFHSLLKAHAPEAKIVVRQALEILTPSFPTRMEDGFITLGSYTKKILIEENNIIPQLAHMLYIIVKYHKVYYLIRHMLITHMISSFQKVGLSVNSQPENRQLAIDLTEVILRWEVQRVRDFEIYRSTDDSFAEQRQQIKSLLVKFPEMLTSFDKNVADCLLNFFVRTACPMTDPLQQQQQQPQQPQTSQQQMHLNQNEALSKRCFYLFQMAISNETWPNADIKFEHLDKILSSLEPLPVNTASSTSLQQQPQPYYTSICTCIELIIFLVESSSHSRSKIQSIFKSVQRGLTACIMSSNSRVVKAISALVQKIMSIIPVEHFNNNPNSINATSSTTTATLASTTSPSTPASTATLTAMSNPTETQADTIYALFGQPDGILCKTIVDALSLYEKTSLNDSNSNAAAFTQSSSVESLTNCLLLLKSASINNPQYIDRLMVPFMKILQKLHRDHLNATNLASSNMSQVSAGSTSLENSNLLQLSNSQQTINAFSELLIQSLDLIKFRIGVMSIEMRKIFINSILVTLIDKSIDLRVIRYLVKMISEWIKYNKNGPLINQIPTLKEKLVLLQRLTISMEKRFADQTDLQQIFLETIAYVYKDEVYAGNNEFKIKLEQSFLTGLKFSNPEIRQMFFEIFNTNFNSTDLYERLCYIIVTQNWESFGTHYWIKQCIQMTLGACATADMSIQFSDITASRFKFPRFFSASSESFSCHTATSQSDSTTQNVLPDQPINTVLNLDTNLSNSSLWPDEETSVMLADPEKSTETTDFSVYSVKRFINREGTREELITALNENQFRLFNYCKEASKNSSIIVSMCQLCHMNTELAHQIWIQLFIQMFNLLSPKQQQNLFGELTPFVASGSHILQKQSQLSTLNTFIESFSMAKPVSLPLRPSLLAYLAKNHNLWHRAILLLENSLSSSTELSSGQQQQSSNTESSQSIQTNVYESTTCQQQQQQNALQNVQHETFSSLSQLYSQLKEDDYKAGLWYKRAIHNNTRTAIMYEQQGLFYQSQKLYEEIIARTVDLYINEPNLTNQDELLEFNLWEERWIRCCKELNQWTELNEYSQSKESDISLSLECAWKQPTNDWQSMKSLLQTPQKDINLPKEKSWRWSLYQGYYLVCNPEDYNHLMMITANSAASTSGQQLVISPSTAVESKMERCMHMALKEWRRLPRLVSPVHITLLQAAQQIVELQEAFQIQNNLLTLAQLNQPGSSNSNINPNSILQEIKAIIKTWRARLPLISDDLSYWNDIFTWRQYHYESFTRFYDKQQAISGTGANPAMLGVHALAQGIVHFGKIARKQHLYDLCLETLNKIHKKQSVPVIDCFLKVKQEIKCYINTFDYLSKQQSQELLDVIEATNLKYFTKENVAELISLKAHFLQLCGKYDDANHLYSFSIYLNDAQPRLWGSWGDYLTQAYVNVSSASPTSFQKRSIETAESALIALMHAARHPNSECKARKFIAKILWLLTYDNDRRQLFTIFDMYSTQIPAANWINWIPQLITLLVKNDDTGKYLINLMHQICRMYPLALYYPLRSLYLKLKSEENTEKIKFQYQQQIQQQQQQQQGNDVEMKESPSTPKPMPQPSTTTESLIRVTKLMHSQREMHPTLFNTLENLIDQLLWLKVNWYEESLRNFKQTLYACYTLVFDYISLCLKNPRQQQQQPIHEYCIDPFSIIWFKRLFKFYADTSYLEKYQLNRNLFNNANNSPSTPTTAGGSAANQQANSSQNHRFRSILAVFNDPNYLITRQKFQQDFNYQLSNTPSVNVFSMISKLKSWVKLFELHLKTGPKQQLLEERLKNVTQFCSSTADIEIPGEFLIPRHTNYYVKISKFLPKLEWVEKYNAYSRRISIRGHNGKIYPFLISNESNYYECRKEEHIMQLMRMINTYMSKQKETSRRNLHFTLPRIVSLSNEVRMVEDDCSATGLLDVYKNRMRKLSMHKAFTQTSNKAQTKSSSTPEVSPPTNLKILLMSEAGDLPLARYFERIQMASASISSAASSSSSTSNTNSTQMPAINKQFFVDLYKVIAGTLLPKTLLKEWAVHAYSDSTDYFHFRKLFTSQLAIFSLIEHVCCLTRINPDQFYLSQNTGTCQSIRLKFDLNESFNSNQTNVSSMLSYYQQITDFNPERPVPFRLSPNVSEFITSAGISGLLSAIKIALARCLVQPQYQFSWILRAILKDEILTCVSRKKQEEIIKTNIVINNTNSNSVQCEQEAEALINLVNKLVLQIENRIKDCASLEGGKSHIINELIPKAMNIDNLAQMDPLWYPWL